MPTRPEPKRISRRTFLKRASFGALGVVGPSGLASTHWLSIERSRLPLPRWNAPPYRVAFISDLHLDDDRDVEVTRRAIRAAVDFRPHVIAFGGDYLTYNPTQNLALLRQALEPLMSAPCPVVGILGNHDFWAGRVAKTVAQLEDSGVTVLQNHDVEIGGVRIIGFDDGGLGRPAYKAFQPDGKPTIVLLHEPDLVRYSPSWAHVQLSGHSHGGQICLPGGIPLMGTREAERYVRGFYLDAPIPLYVTRGIGTRRVPVRYFCRPEVSLLTLTSPE